MGQALYRKYRSRSLDEVVGQQHVTSTLAKAIKSGKISHAYLFTGPRGVGKTSVARILAHEVNGLPYKDDSVHFDIIEIDAASNRRIDEIRDLRDKVHIAPTSAKYKIYIIDEVHMLTREAFNALLKTLEEPPAHCIFILATTEEHKLPETIISRTQRFNFKPVNKKNAAKHLAELAKKEKIEISQDALLLLAEHGKGSFRDSISLLDQLSTSGDKITEEKVREVLGLPTYSSVEILISHISNGESQNILTDLDKLNEQGVNTAQITTELSKQLRTLLMNGTDYIWVPKLLKMLLKVSSSTQPTDMLEISLLQIANENYSGGNVSIPAVNKKGLQSRSAEYKKQANLTVNKVEVLDSKIIHADFDLKTWPDVVTYSKDRAASIYTALKLAIPSYSDSTLTLNFRFPLHQKKLNQAKQKDMISQMIHEVTGSVVKIECVVNRQKFEKKKLEPKKDIDIQKIQPSNKELKSISNIFGNAEVLES